MIDICDLKMNNNQEKDLSSFSKYVGKILKKILGKYN
jgi:hypothetical protein